MAKVGRPLKYETPEELQEAIDSYFEECSPEMVKDKDGNIVRDNQGRPVFKMNPPTITGLALHLGFADRRSIYEYKEKPQFTLTIKKARLKCENFIEKGLYTGEIPAAGAIFSLKNFGWSDRHDINFKDETDYEEQQKKLDAIKKKHIDD
jgi:hypothetical protein